MVEGDEYDTAFFDKGSKFLHYRPKIAILTSVELDHVDIFRDEEAVHAAFRKFVALIPDDGLLVACAASPGAMEVARVARCQVVTYGRPGAGARLDVRGRRARLGETDHAGAGPPRRAGRSVETNLPGIYNHENLIGVVAVAASLGIELPVIAAACGGSWACGGGRRSAASRAA